MYEIAITLIIIYNKWNIILRKFVFMYKLVYYNELVPLNKKWTSRLAHDKSDYCQVSYLLDSNILQ